MGARPSALIVQDLRFTTEVQARNPGPQARIIDPPAEDAELAQAPVDALAQAKFGRTPEAAVHVLLSAVQQLQNGRRTA